MDLFASLLAARGELVLERAPDGRFLQRGLLPAWCQALHPEEQITRGPFVASEMFPFLEAFLPEAERAWGAGARADSQFWTEVTAQGEEIHLEATALRLWGTSLLVITRNDRLFSQQQLLLQRARELYLTYAALTREMQQKDVLVHCIVHDLAAPLGSILGALSLLHERDQPTEKWSRLALDAAMRQRELIREILYVFSEESGASDTPETATSDLYAGIARVMRELEPVARGRNIAVQAPPEVWRGAPRQVIAEETRLIRVLANLLENAIRHSPAGGVVELTLREEEGMLEVGVEDEGPGVPEALVPRLFQKFIKGRDRWSGTGLGLYFCRITVERWGGAIGYEPRAKGGSRFWFRLREAA